MVMVATCSTTETAPLLCLFASTRSRLLFRSWRQRQLRRTRAVVFRRDDTLQTSKNFTGDDQATLTVDKNSAIYFVYIYEIATNFPAAASWLMELRSFRRSLERHVAHVKISPGKTRIDRYSTNMKIYAYEIKQNVSKNFFLLLRTTPLLTALRTVFPTITRSGFCSHLRKIISRRPLTPPKNRDIHIVEFFVDSIYSKSIDIIRTKILIFYF